MKKSNYTEVELKEIEAIQEQRSITRKSAVRIFEKADRRIILTAAPVAPVVESAPVDQNEPIVSDAAPAKKTRVKKEAAPVVKLSPEAAGAARKEGMRLFQLAGRPTKEQFVLVFGDKGAAMTWDARAKAAGLGSAQEVAEKFQSLLTSKSN